MLAKFAVTNYRGFKDRIEWDLSKPANYEFNRNAVKDGVIKNGIIYGPNGTGKTNFGLAIFDIVNHISQRYKKPDYYRNFLYAGKENAVVEFEYTFKFGGEIVQYNYAKTRGGRLVNESLMLDQTSVFNHSGSVLGVNDKMFTLTPVMKDSILQGANDISIVNFLLSSFPLAEGHFLIRLRDFVNGMLWFSNFYVNGFIGLETNTDELDAYIIKENLVDDFASFLEDVSGQTFVFVKPMAGDKILWCRFNGGRIPFEAIASTGTKTLVTLYYWIKKMGDASFVFIDEFDAFYHFRLAYEVCKRLFDMDCQIFTSSHNTYLMTNDLLRPDCNFILSDNKIKPLCDCTDKELRFGHNIEKLFRGNAFNV